MLALDSNVVSAIFRAEDSAEAILALLEVRTGEEIVMHGAAFCEFLAGPGIREEDALDFLRDTGVRVEWQTGEVLWLRAARTFKEYAARRRRSGGERPRRILADFLIGAHAESLGATLVTLDPQHFRQNFAGLAVVNPVE
ncbi:type II toxin-antitoxin system VapC family toxin [Deinococcus sp. YIM 134068]|uniref:type II toxin-antitoxin system VapC family toxin n=1 Tax=Deinococcus lichenicola TaxID=3118910 RepID=UPI002F955C77